MHEVTSALLFIKLCFDSGRQYVPVFVNVASQLLRWLDLPQLTCR
jgi:hypothetical protein